MLCYTVYLEIVAIYEGMPMNSLKRIPALLLCLGFLLALTGCGSVAATEKQLFAMNSAITIKAYGKSAQSGIDSAVSVINSLDSALNPKYDGSTVNAINSSQGQSVVLTGQVAEMLLTAQKVYSLSGGSFDPTVYPLVKAWGFIDGLYRVPSESEIEGLVKNVDFSKVSISAMSDSDSYLLTMPAGMELSFAAVGRGCAAMYAVRAMEAAGVESGIVSIGGNVQALGTKPDGSDWIIAVQNPTNPAEYVCTLNLKEGCAVVTSGGYQRYFTDDDGNTWTHLIDPNDGYPAESGLLSATVVCDDGIFADALSTALCIMGEDKAVKLYEDSGEGFEMLLITDDGRILVSDGLIESVERSNDDFTVEYVRK